jgi:hypothetical protein
MFREIRWQISLSASVALDQRISLHRSSERGWVTGLEGASRQAQGDARS